MNFGGGPDRSEPKPKHPSVRTPPELNKENDAMPPTTLDSGTDHAAAAVLEVAERLHSVKPEWVVFFREVLGVDGIVRRTFNTPEALIWFECTPQYARIREMLDELRERERERPADRETQRVVTVRMPSSLHETLKAEADQMRVSINTLCISKLMKLIDGEGRRELTAPPPRASQAPQEEPAA